MDEWTKRFLWQQNQCSATVSTLQDMERRVQFAQNFLSGQASAASAALETIDSQATYLGMVLGQRGSVHTLGLSATGLDWDHLSQFTVAADLLREEHANRRHQTMVFSSIIDDAKALAHIAQASKLQVAIEPFRTSVGEFTNKLLHLESLDVLRSSTYLDAFVQASAISNVFSVSDRVDRRMREATREFSLAAVPAFDDLNGYRQFLNASGLVLPHWPSVRLLTIGEKRRRLREKLKNNSEQMHVRKGKSLVQRYELTFRDILDEVMERTYGENWAENRLPLCECKDLLGKWRKRGGHVLAHADYAHYERIMTFPSHFEDVFEVGFEDRDELVAIVKKAGDLRAALFHFHPFSQEDLRDLRVTWLTIETGLLALTSDYDLDDRF